MQGVKFIINSKGEKTGVVLDLRRHRALWEDLYDNLLAEKRAHEPRETLEAVKRRLQQKGKLPHE